MPKNIIREISEVGNGVGLYSESLSAVVLRWCIDCWLVLGGRGGYRSLWTVCQGSRARHEAVLTTEGSDDKNTNRDIFVIEFYQCFFR